MLRHTVLFSRSRVTFAISSHSAANRRNRSDVSIGRPPCWSRCLREAMQSPPKCSGPTLPKCYAAHGALQKRARRVARCGGSTGVCRSSASFINFFNFFVARVEQSETRERQSSRTFVPGLRYETETRRENMRFRRRGWLNKLPLPRGERVGVRGFGRFRIKLHHPNPLILSFSPHQRVYARLRRAMGEKERSLPAEPRWCAATCFTFSAGRCI
jgi:hypothetical protein